MKTLSVTIICKDEESNLARLLPKLNFADQIVVVDTGSADGSAKIAKQYSDDVFYYKWRDDFAKARNYAISKAVCDYIMWLDCDDDLPQSTVLRIKHWLSDDGSRQDFVYLKYRMGQNGKFWFWRERIIRRCKLCRFKGFIHEAIVPFGQTYYLDCEIIHTSAEDHSARNLQIYRNALSRGRRFSPRDTYYYARTLYENGLFDEAVPLLVKSTANSKTYLIDRIGGYKLLVRYYIKQNDYARALKCLSKSVILSPPDAESCCLFGDCYYLLRNYLCAVRWYEYALASAVQIGFVNDWYKFIYPYIQLSVCWWRLGDVRRSRHYHKLAKNCDPSNETVQNNDKWFK